MLCGGVAACHGMVCVLFVVLSRTQEQEPCTQASKQRINAVPYGALSMCHNVCRRVFIY